MRSIDKLLNGITMYRMMLYGLSVIAAVSVIFSYTGVLSLPASGMLITFLTLIAVCTGSNWLISRFWPAITNRESSFITALILGFILPQTTSLSRWLAIILAGVIAMASKYLLAYYSKHLFNPAASAAVILSLAGLLPATWWIGTPIMLPFTAFFGFMLLRKLRRFQLFGSFAVAALLVVGLVALANGDPAGEALKQAVLSSPLIFLGSVMLTEPLTMPPRAQQQLIYGALVGALFTSQLRAGIISATPELALVIGNLYSYAVSPKYKLRLRLKQRLQLSKNVYEFVFTPDRPLKFLPGQYLEWTLPVVKGDLRGNRRSFTIASSPTEPDIRLGIKTYTPTSRFKATLLAMPLGGLMMGGQLGGSFVMPADPKQKLVFIAGGIGITPFRSMAKYLVDTKTKRQVVLFYMVSDPDEISFRDIFSQAAAYGLTLVPVLSVAQGKPVSDWTGETGYLTPELIKKYVPDYASRTYYLSGPNAMVGIYERLLHSQNIPRRAIKKDYFSGY